MRSEIYFQYTSRWHRVDVGDTQVLSSMIEWCVSHPSPHGFHVNRYDEAFYHRIDPRHIYRCEMRFESQEDAVHFALTWCGEETA